MKHKSVKYLLCFFLMSSVAFDVAGMFGNAAFNFGVAAVGAFCGGASRFGVQFGGNGQFQGTFAQVRDPFGRLVVDVNPKPELKDISPIRPRIEMNGGEDIARASFSGWAPNTRYDVQFVDGLEYHRANDGHAEFWSLAQGRGWNQTDRPMIGVTHFAGQPVNLEFETTPLIWHFDTKIINGRRYNHAWTDTLLDFMVPEGERHRICAPSWYIKQHEAEQKKLRAEICKATLELTQKRVAEGFLQEANWGALNAAREINLHHRTEARNIATEALFYYEKAVEALRPIGGFVERVFEEMSVPGGVENLRKYRDGRLTSEKYNQIVSEEIAVDTTAAMVGAFIGGAGGAFAGASAGPVGAVAVSDIGAAKGAAAGYVASKATRAVARAIMNFSTGAGSGGDRTRTSEVRAERKYGQGKFWDGDLFSADSQAPVPGLSAKKHNIIVGRILRAKRRFGGEVKADKDGFLYKFDPAHKDRKVHLEKIVERNEGFYGVAEIDPETGKVLRVFKEGERRYGK